MHYTHTQGYESIDRLPKTVSSYMVVSVSLPIYYSLRLLLDHISKKAGDVKMLYTILWLIIWLMMGGTSISVGTGEFMALIVAILADLFLNGYLRPFWRR